MFAYNDAWLMNESLALYMSTNTFSNPLFNQNLTPSDHYRVAGYNQEDFGSRALLNENLKQTMAYGTKENGKKSCTLQDQYNCQKHNLAQRFKNFPGPSKWALNHKQRLRDICDGLAYSLRSKAFVLELNLKRNLRALRRFATKNMSWMLPISSDASHRNSKRRNRRHNGGSSLSNSDSFWQSLEQFEPDCKNSLNIQQEQLLSRLERVVQAKRSGQLKRNLEEIASVSGDCKSYYAATETSNNNNIGVNKHQRFVEEFIHPVGVYGGNDLTWDDTNEQHQRLSLEHSASGSASLAMDCNNIEQILSDELTTGSLISSSASMASIGAVGSLGTKRGDNVSCMDSNLASLTIAAPTTSNNKPTSIGQRTKQRYRLSGVSRSKSADQRGFVTTKSCIVCYSNFPNIVTLPCKHNNVCSDCLIEIIYMAVKQKQFPLKCVLCRQKVEQIRVSRRWLISVIGKDQTTIE